MWTRAPQASVCDRRRALESSVNRSGRASRELLKNNRASDCIEVSAVARRPAFVDAYLVDHLRQNRIDLFEMGNSFSSEWIRTSRLHFCP